MDIAGRVVVLGRLYTPKICQYVLDNCGDSSRGPGYQRQAPACVERRVNKQVEVGWAVGQLVRGGCAHGIVVLG